MEPLSLNAYSEQSLPPTPVEYDSDEEIKLR